MKLNITGDFCITAPYLLKDLFTSEVVSLFKNSDFNIINLECPIISENQLNNKILKTGPHIFTYDGIFDHLRKLNINVVALANNHILDYGVTGLERAGQRPARAGLHHRRIHLHKAAIPEECSYFPDNSGTQVEDFSRLRVGDQVEVPLAVPGLHVP